MPDLEKRGNPIDRALLRGDVLAELCPSRTILRQATTRWAVLCLLVLRRREARFSDLRRAIGGVSERMLSRTLQDLAHHGLVRRVSHPVVPPHVDYSLTPLGAEMAERIEALTGWLEHNINRFPNADAGRDAA
ncbi:MAG TPA: helix-turn-helix domain-containing protein [Methylomirabilota bacterium]|nr:helix-turn-helix domain-containing protein [Methylomirabilota bacterium]